MGELSAWHWLVVIGVFIVLFGAKRLPDAARNLGRSTRILKAELRADAPEPAATARVTPADASAEPPTAGSPAAPTAPAPAPADQGQTGVR
jgi:sec-independent protein translocase protein TatA